MCSKYKVDYPDKTLEDFYNHLMNSFPDTITMLEAFKKAIINPLSDDMDDLMKQCIYNMVDDNLKLTRQIQEGYVVNSKSYFLSDLTDSLKRWLLANDLEIFMTGDVYLDLYIYLFLDSDHSYTSDFDMELKTLALKHSIKTWALPSGEFKCYDNMMEYGFHDGKYSIVAKSPCLNVLEVQQVRYKNCALATNRRFVLSDFYLQEERKDKRFDFDKTLRFHDYLGELFCLKLHDPNCLTILGIFDVGPPPNLSMPELEYNSRPHLTDYYLVCISVNGLQMSRYRGCHVSDGHKFILGNVTDVRNLFIFERFLFLQATHYGKSYICIFNDFKLVCNVVVPCPGDVEWNVMEGQLQYTVKTNPITKYAFDENYALFSIL